MRVLHSFWLPEPGNAFVQSGAFWLWVETLPPAGTGSDRARQAAAHSHPFQLPGPAWPELLGDLGLVPKSERGKPTLNAQRIWLPSAAGAPLPSPQLAKSWPEPFEGASTDPVDLQPWGVECYRLGRPIKQLADIHFLAFYQAAGLEPGGDFLFWYWLTQNLKRLLMRDRYLPALVYRQPPPPKGKRKKPPYEIHGGWAWASDDYERLIQDATECMPAVGAAGMEGLADPESLLHHASEVLLDDILRSVTIPATFAKRFQGSLLDACLAAEPAARPWPQPGAGLEGYQHWQQWRQRIQGSGRDASFTLGFRLVEPSDESENDWTLEFVAVPKDDPSQRLALAEYWPLSAAERKHAGRPLGADFETQVLLDLGLAARMLPTLWAGLDTATPQSVTLDLDDAFRFLKEDAWILEDAGFKVIVPAWWTPKGRQRVRIRLRSGKQREKTTGSAAGTGILSLDNLIRYRYQLAIGDEPVSEEEWEQLVAAKTPLVRFRGQWVELDRDQMQEMLRFWREHGQETAEMDLQSLLQRTATEDLFEVERDDALAEMLERLRDRSQLEPIAELPGLNAELRDYQKRGVAWLEFLDRLGLNGCLADDMGLGKTMQVIARLVREREGAAAHGDRKVGGDANTKPPGPTLLIAPTSVIGNWRKEVERFAPQLSVLMHHGTDRLSDAKAFKQAVAGQALVITSYALARRDQPLLAAVDWHRLVLDEAQNIKNPKAAQTKAIGKLRATHRLALTGTPVENRLMDLWSILHFLNPGYLDTQARFRKRFELPVQRDQDPVQTATLKRLVEPFILRRVKTDKAIIRDLPDKIEAIQYCNLGREQAALYESVVRQVERDLEEKEGIERQGLMLSTLMRLKQICNHPAQFLQDGSPFSPERSHKLQRLQEMLEEVMAEGDSVLIFSQFTEVGAALEKLLRQEWRFNSFYLHGGSSRTRREEMIASFQDPDTEPSVFVLSLKAGGVGITLTKANHVFHFDRWWNPAVEDQASDRAFRIGQEKTVFVHKMVTLGTLEERIDEMIRSKQALAGAIVGNDESWLAQLDNERFKALIQLNRDAVVD
ncbi:MULTISPECIES: DEAD/DEAH box helicase [Thiorhodovibrio]|uniref:DEAD/DEAH box helicase n=1 Tax=Thiorhodovibrio TaxID=61593 RepID=UPI001912BB3A|nr:MULTISPECIES: DEAD/DEAH box helicase [Thiorhodovibrio]MBK5967291.1 ATP-dependent helicase [Thiorhodovibrio winogradskyi]WPL14457.1 ATP-dependent helicase HepA [Thiorhodovibrio litoralis]